MADNKLTIAAHTADRPRPEWAADQDILDLLAPKADSIKLALTGGIASGKSVVQEILVTLGAAEIDFDVLARRAVEPEYALDQVTALFAAQGHKVLTPAGTLDRRLVAKIIFKNPDLKTELENILHPLVWRLMGEELKRLAPLGHKITVISIPLLFETGLYHYFSPVALCFAAPETQLKRLRQRDPQMGFWQARRIIKSQMPAPLKLKKADYIIDNNGSLIETIRSCKKLWDELKRQTSK